MNKSIKVFVVIAGIAIYMVFMVALASELVGNNL